MTCFEGVRLLLNLPCAILMCEAKSILITCASAMQADRASDVHAWETMNIKKWPKHPVSL